MYDRSINNVSLKVTFLLRISGGHENSFSPPWIHVWAQLIVCYIILLLFKKIKIKTIGLINVLCYLSLWFGVIGTTFDNTYSSKWISPCFTVWAGSIVGLITSLPFDVYELAGSELKITYWKSCKNNSLLLDHSSLLSEK